MANNYGGSPPIAPPEQTTELLQAAGGVIQPETVKTLQELGEHWSGAAFIDEHGKPIPPPPTRWLIKDFFEASKLGLLFGLGDAGKSYLGFMMSVSVITGKPFLGKQVCRQGPVLYLTDEEGQDDFHRRFDVIRGQMELDDADCQAVRSNLHFVILRYPQLVTHPRMAGPDTEPATDSLQNISRIAGDFALIVPDPIVSYFAGDENSAVDASRFMSTLDRRLTGNGKGAAVLGIHHSNKGPMSATGPDSANMRGSTAFRNRSRVAWELFGLNPNAARDRGLDCSDDETRKRWAVLAHDKGNSMKKEKEIYLERVDGGFLVPHAEPPPAMTGGDGGWGASDNMAALKG